MKSNNEIEIDDFLSLKKELKINRHKQIITFCLILAAIAFHFFAPQLELVAMGLSFLSLAETIFPSRERQALQHIQRSINSDPEKLALFVEKTKDE